MKEETNNWYSKQQQTATIYPT